MQAACPQTGTALMCGQWTFKNAWSQGQSVKTLLENSLILVKMMLVVMVMVLVVVLVILIAPVSTIPGTAHTVSGGSNPWDRRRLLGLHFNMDPWVRTFACHAVQCRRSERQDMPMKNTDAELRSICTLDKHRICAVADHPPSPHSSLRWLYICAAFTVAS